MPLLHPTRNSSLQRLQEVDKPELYRDMFPYTKISRIPFNGV